MRKHLIAVLVILQASCGHIPSYPSNWPAQKLIRNGECPTISGKFLDEGVDQDGRSASLARSLFSPGRIITDAKFVDVKLESSKLNVSATTPIPPPLTSVIDLLGPCVNGEALIEDPIGEYSPEGMVTYSSRVALSIADDGSLVVRRKWIRGGLVFYVEKGAEWQKFTPLQ